MPENLKLSKRETEIVKLIAQAKCRKVIATELNIAVSTVDKHLHNIFLKTKTTATQELTPWIINSKQ